MKDITPKPTKKPSGWSAVRQRISTWDQALLVTLVKDLYDASASNKDFINARCHVEGSNGNILESYRHKIVKQFFPKRGEPKLKLAEARKAIHDYRKATGNIAGTAELMMTYVENGAQFTAEYGDIDERFYNSIESVLSELAALLRSDRDLYLSFQVRLAVVKHLTRDIGWGFHDFIVEVVD